MRDFAENCGACSKEYLNSELTPIKFGSFLLSRIRICGSCKKINDAAKDYKQAAELISAAFVDNDPELASPAVAIEPAHSLVQKAVDLIKKVDPQFFVGVRKIVVNAEPNYGHVESGPGKDPAVINLNLVKIQNEIKSQSAGGDPLETEKAIVRSLASTIAHERGHVKSFNPASGFQGGEGPADTEEQRIVSLIDKQP